MILDISGVMLIPGNLGTDCLGNGTHPGIECCCDECDYLMCCLEDHNPTECKTCTDMDCPHSVNQNSK